MSKPNHLAERTQGPSPRSIGQQLGHLFITGSDHGSPPRYRHAVQTQQAPPPPPPPAPTKPNPKTSPKPLKSYGKKTLQDDVNGTPFNNRLKLRAPSQSKRKVTARSGSREGATLDWLPSKNLGENILQLRVTAELLVAPKSAYLVSDIVQKHNVEVFSRNPRMRLRELGDSGDPQCWELIPLAKDLGPNYPQTSCKYQLKTPVITLSSRVISQDRNRAFVVRSTEFWPDYFEATGNFLLNNYMIQGINGFLPALFFSISTFERRRDFKRIVQAFIHFNKLWPIFLTRDDRKSESSESRIIMEDSYISHHPDYWSAVPTTGEIFLHVRQASAVSARSVFWTQFVFNFVSAAIDSPSLDHIEQYPVTHQGLNDFIFQGPVKTDRDSDKPFL